MNLLLVDDHALFREGLRGLLSNLSPDVSIHETATLEGAIDECRQTRYRMVLLDLGLGRSSGLETLDQFRDGAPDVPVVVLSGEQQAQHIKAAIDHGAAGFIPKSHTSARMIAALQFVLGGGIYLPVELLDDAAAHNTGFEERMARLSPRQSVVCRLLLQGLSNKHIARELGLSEGTVKAHASAVYQIMGARNRVDAVILAAKSGVQIM